MLLCYLGIKIQLDSFVICWFGIYNVKRLKRAIRCKYFSALAELLPGFKLGAGPPLEVTKASHLFDFKGSQQFTK